MNLLISTALLISVALGSVQQPENPSLAPACTGISVSLTTDSPSCQQSEPEPINKPTLKWEQMEEFTLAGDVFQLRVETNAVCCGSSTEQGGSPIRIYLAPYDDPPRNRADALLVYLGNGDRVVVKKEREAGWFADEIYRSEEAAQRDGGWVMLKIPRSVLPAGDLRLWLGRSHAVGVGTVVLNRSRGSLAPPEAAYPFVAIRQD